MLDLELLTAEDTQDVSGGYAFNIGDECNPSDNCGPLTQCNPNDPSYCRPDSCRP
jgi:hypothetical protein